MKVRREVLGAEYVDRSMAQANDFMAPFQRMTTEWCWGGAWTRAGALDRRERSLMNLAMLTALGKPNELKLHVNGRAQQRALGRRDPRSAAARHRLLRHPGRAGGVPRRQRRR